MQPTVSIDLREFNAQLKRAIAYSNRAAHVVVNTQALAFAKRAMDETKRASLADIHALNAKKVIRVETTTKKGKQRKRPKKIYAKSYTLAELIIIKRMKAMKRKWTIDEVRILAKKMISARAKSIAFIASGWLPALRKLIKWDRERRGMPSASEIAKRKGAKQYGKAKGDATPARLVASMRPIARLINNAIIKTNRWDELVGRQGRGDPIKYAMQGVRRAEAISIADMEKHITEKLMKLKNNSTNRSLKP